MHWHGRLDGPRLMGSEKALERALRRARFEFQRHVHLERYEIDFLVDNVVAVEVDGFVHVQRSVRAKDAIKTEQLERAGYKVLRFTADECRYLTKQCVKRLAEAVKEARADVGSRVCPGGSAERLAPWQQALLLIREAIANGNSD